MSRRKALLAANIALAAAGTSFLAYIGYGTQSRKEGMGQAASRYHASGTPDRAPMPMKTPPDPFQGAKKASGAEKQTAPAISGPPASAPPDALQSAPTIILPSPKYEPIPESEVRGEMLRIIRSRVAQDGPKMKLSPEEGLRAEGYVLKDLPSMPGCRHLALFMPKTAVELLRAANERGVPRGDAEEISAYLSRLHASLKMQNPLPFDENTSHVIGREWHEIDYSGEGMSWQSQKRFYSGHGISDLRSAENVRNLFALESTFPYFRKIYRPEGRLPDF